jgi:hypothetical protein
VAHGQIPRFGMVCMRHKRWLGSPQSSVRRFIPALSAERHFRSRLAAQGMVFDSPVMMVAREAVVAGLGPSELRRRRRTFDVEPVETLVYPEQVAVARLLARPSFLLAAAEPTVDLRTRHALVAQAVTSLLPSGEDAEPWRAVTRVWHVVSRLSGEIRDVRAYGRSTWKTSYGQ